MLGQSYFDSLVVYARSFLGVPYIYGGNNCLTGFDCSGYMSEVLRKPGLVRNHEDISVQGIYERVAKEGTSITTGPMKFPGGTLLFYGESLTNLEHVALVVDWYSIIECGGGNEKTDSIDKAKALGACVRERGILLRSDIEVAILPKYPWSRGWP